MLLRPGDMLLTGEPLPLQIVSVCRSGFQVDLRCIHPLYVTLHRIGYDAYMNVDTIDLFHT